MVKHDARSNERASIYAMHESNIEEYPKWLEYNKVNSHIVNEWYRTWMKQSVLTNKIPFEFFCNLYLDWKCKQTSASTD